MLSIGSNTLMNDVNGVYATKTLHYKYISYNNSMITVLKYQGKLTVRNIK